MGVLHISTISQRCLEKERLGHSFALGEGSGDKNKLEADQLYTEPKHNAQGPWPQPRED